MLKGDLAGTPLPALLEQLADGAATGCLHVLDPVGDEAKVYLRGGRVYAVVAPGLRPQLGARLVSSGDLAPEALAEALEAQRTELQGWRLGELLVHLSYVDQPVVEAFVQEQVRESLSDLLEWPAATWKFRINERTREDVAPPVSVAEVLTEVRRRQAEWQTIADVVGGPFTRCAKGLPEWFEANVRPHRLAAAGERVAVGTERDVYASHDAGRSWKLVASGLPSIRAVVVA